MGDHVAGRVKKGSNGTRRTEPHPTEYVPAENDWRGWVNPPRPGVPYGSGCRSRRPVRVFLNLARTGRRSYRTDCGVGYRVTGSRPGGFQG
ncbi:hypothetical protein GCM10010104_30060 [Streptomyces indiaensis]|uniref:Uncharacterized protein n=1 Tax=Streptomyces indiaensis TaxID=284033 RepID=A0ABN3DJP4_9ACTN